MWCFIMYNKSWFVQHINIRNYYYFFSHILRCYYCVLLLLLFPSSYGWRIKWNDEREEEKDNEHTQNRQTVRIHNWTNQFYVFVCMRDAINTRERERKKSFILVSMRTWMRETLMTSWNDTFLVDVWDIDSMT